MKRKRIIHILLLAAILLLPLSLSAQNKGFQLPSKKQSTTKSSGYKSSNSPKSKKQKKHSSNPIKQSHNFQTSLSTQSSQRQIPEVIQCLINNMVYVEGGTFTMGATAEQGSDAYDDEKPAHRVTLSSFCIGIYEVTQAEWLAVMEYNPSQFTGNLKRPVEQVSWDDCQEFIRKLNNMTGKLFRLPTEAEWEFAARGGEKSKQYKFAGNNILENVAWYCKNSNSNTHIVGKKGLNELGIADMCGNVSEWCQDWFGNYRNAPLINNPQGTSNGSFRIIRGGSYQDSDECCRVTYRNSNVPSYKSEEVGFRLVMTPGSEIMPQFPGGEAALMKYISNHIQYPLSAQQNNIQGKVVVQFVVTQNGSIGEVKIIQSVCEDLDNEAIRLCRFLPRFTPGYQDGHPVNVWYTLPINFRLTEEKELLLY